jgi:hypothetical protein
MSAPLQMVMLAFDGNRFEGRILAELKRLREEGIVRLVGLLFVRKDVDGSITSLQESDLEPPTALLIGSAMRDLIGTRRFATVTGGASETSLFGYTDADIRRIAAEIPKDTAVALALFEHLWALQLKEAIVDAGGFVAADGLVGPSALMALEEEFGRFDQLAEQPLN